MGQSFSIGIRIVFFVLLQGLVLNNVELFGFASPFLYIISILTLPVESNRSLVLILSFFIGLSVDLFTQTWGMHTSACVFIGFLRPYLLSIISPRDGYSVGVLPDMSHLGINWFLAYSLIMIVAHHFFLFFVEVFRFEEFFFTIGRALASVVFTFVLVLVTQFLSFKQKRIL